MSLYDLIPSAYFAGGYTRLCLDSRRKSDGVRYVSWVSVSEELFLQAQDAKDGPRQWIIARLRDQRDRNTEVSADQWSEKMLMHLPEGGPSLYKPPPKELNWL